MTDIVITYLNSGREQWIQSYNYYKEQEINSGAANPQDRQSFGAERFRDWNNLHYWFRGVEQNCGWVRKVFLVVQSMDQVPDWIVTNHPNLRIVTHDEFIPSELLPTFNPLTIELFFYRIPDLSEQYISCNDDHFFISPIKENFFFENGKPKQPENKREWKLFNTNKSDGTFYATFNNVLMVEKDIINELYPGKEPWTYFYTHLPYPRLKSMDKQICEKYWYLFIAGASHSRFRNPHNYCSTIYDDALKFYNKSIIDNNMFNNSAYIALKSTVNFNDYLNKDIVCFNDTEQLDNFEETKKKFDEFLQKKFPNKSSFEK